MASTATSAPDRAWGNENGLAIDALLQFSSSIAFARAGTALLKACGYQVLDSAGTHALKKACDGKPTAVTVGLVDSPGYVSCGPLKPRTPEFSRAMGFSTFSTISGSGNQLSVYVPFFPGERPTGAAIRTKAAESPLRKLPSRLVLTFSNPDEVETRIEWLDDLKTARDHKTVSWVMQDRFLKAKINHSEADWPLHTATHLGIMALKFMLNSPMEGSGSLWVQGGTEIVTPFVPGVAYKIFNTALPVFSSSKTDWNVRGVNSIKDLQAPEPSSDVKADFLMVQSKYDKEPRNYLTSLPNGFDSLQSYGRSAMLGFLYSVLMPKEVHIARTYQINERSWLNTTCNIKSPIACPPTSANAPINWKADKESVSLKILSGHNLTDTGSVSVAIGLKQNFNYVGLESLATKGVGGVGFERVGGACVFTSAVYRFAGGSVQFATEGSKAAGVFAHSPLPWSNFVKCQLGCRWRSGSNMEYGIGMSAEL